MDFIGSFISVSSLIDDGKREICLLARSNVGKSSLINTLAKKKIARVSKTPGRTQTINLYAFDHEKRIVDLPGYGYANVSKEKAFLFNELLESYLNYRRQLVMVLQMCDANVVTSQDIIVAKQFSHKKFFHLVVFNKCDRLSSQRLLLEQKKHREQFYPGCFLIYISCKQAQNIDKIYQIINSI